MLVKAPRDMRLSQLNTVELCARIYLIQISIFHQNCFQVIK